MTSLKRREDVSPECSLCGEDHIGESEEAVLIIPGAWYRSSEYGIPVFMLDTKVGMDVLKMPNGQIALVPNTEYTTTAHLECYLQLEGDFDLDLEEIEEDENDYVHRHF